MSLNYCKQYRKIQNDILEPSLPIKHHKKTEKLFVAFAKLRSSCCYCSGIMHITCLTSDYWFGWMRETIKQNKQHKLLTGQLLELYEALHCATLVPDLLWLFSYQQGCCHWQIVTHQVYCQSHSKFLGCESLTSLCGLEHYKCIVYWRF